MPQPHAATHDCRTAPASRAAAGAAQHPLARVHLRAVSWHRRPPIGMCAVRGTAALHVGELGATLHGVCISLLPDGTPIIKFPEINGATAAGYRPIPLVTFASPDARQALARDAWVAVLRAFPNAAAPYVPSPATAAGVAQEARP